MHLLTKCLERCPIGIDSRGMINIDIHRIEMSIGIGPYGPAQVLINGIIGNWLPGGAFRKDNGADQLSDKSNAIRKSL